MYFKIMCIMHQVKSNNGLIIEIASKINCKVEKTMTIDDEIEFKTLAVFFALFIIYAVKEILING